MEELYFNLKSRFGQAEIIKTSSDVIEIYFKKSKELVVIEKEIDSNRYTASYPELKRHHNGKTSIRYSTMNNLLSEGVFWILKQVRKNGKVMPEF